MALRKNAGPHRHHERAKHGACWEAATRDGLKNRVPRQPECLARALLEMAVPLKLQSNAACVAARPMVIRVAVESSRSRRAQATAVRMVSMVNVEW